LLDVLRRLGSEFQVTTQGLGRLRSDVADLFHGRPLMRPQPAWNSSSRSTPTRTTRCRKSPPMTSSSPTTAHYTTPLRPGLTGRRTWGSGMTPKPGTSADGRTVWVVETHGERYEFDGTLVLVNGRI